LGPRNQGDAGIHAQISILECDAPAWSVQLGQRNRKRKQKKKAISEKRKEATGVEDLIKRLSEVSEESPAFEGLMLRLEMAINSNFSLGSQEEIEFETSWE
jgi:predicted transcriptional regulator